MEYTKKNFQVKDRVTFTRTSSPLDGKSGMVVGKSTEWPMDDYIILLDEEWDGQMAVCMIEKYLTREKE